MVESKSSRGRGLSETDELFDASGVANIVAAAEYLSSDFSDTFTIDPTVSASTVLNSSWIVICTYSVIYVLSFAVVLLRYRYNCCRASVAPDTEGEASGSGDDVKGYLSKLLEEYISIDTERPFVQQLVEDTGKHHEYFSMFLSSSDSSRSTSHSIRNRHSRADIYSNMIESFLKLSTLASLIVFTNILFFDIQYPGNTHVFVICK
jgi:hypothetical protein